MQDRSNNWCWKGSYGHDVPPCGGTLGVGTASKAPSLYDAIVTGQPVPAWALPKLQRIWPWKLPSIPPPNKPGQHINTDVSPLLFRDSGSRVLQTPNCHYPLYFNSTKHFLYLRSLRPLSGVSSLWRIITFPLPRLRTFQLHAPPPLTSDSASARRTRRRFWLPPSRHSLLSSLQLYPAGSLVVYIPAQP